MHYRASPTSAVEESYNLSDREEQWGRRVFMSAHHHGKQFCQHRRCSSSHNSLRVIHPYICTLNHLEFCSEAIKITATIESIIREQLPNQMKPRHQRIIAQHTVYIVHTVQCSYYLNCLTFLKQQYECLSILLGKVRTLLEWADA